MGSKPSVFLIDGSGYIFRAYYAVRPLSTRDGVPTNAVLGFARMLGKLMREKTPAFIGMVFDSPQKTFRHKIYDLYKANRDAPPEDLIPQFGLIREFTAAMSIPVLAAPGYEADDIIATLAQKATDAGYDVVVVSADKDLMQLVREGVVMYDPMKDKTFGHDEVVEKFGVAPNQVADALALAGDSSDNIPGVPKVGPKSAAKLINAYGDVEDVIKGVATVEKPKAFERSVMENADLARLSKKLTVLCYESPVDFDEQALKLHSPDPEILVPFLEKIEARTLLRDLQIDMTSPRPSARPDGQETEVPPPPPTTSLDRTTYETVLTSNKLESIITEIQTAGQCAFDLETTSLDAHSADIVGFALAVPNGGVYYIPVSHRYLGVPTQLKLEDVMGQLKPLLEDERIGKIGQNLKYDFNVLQHAGLTPKGLLHDTMLMAYSLDSSRSSFSLDSLSAEFLHHETISFKDVTGTGKNKITFDQVELATATEYAGEDADAALRLAAIFEPQLSAANVSSLYQELELPLVEVLSDMECAGIKINIQKLENLSVEFSQRLHEVGERAYALLGERINLASPKQLAHQFFEKLGYPVIKKTKTGPSTDHSVLEILARDHELPRVILEHRMISKLKSTYVDSLTRMVNTKTGRVHTSYNQSGTATGRLSSTDPNLQNIPIRTEDGKRIRAAFIPEDGHCLISADYSQIELRVLAHLCEDEDFIDAFVRGEDIHSRTAREILTGGAPVDPESRRKAKAINFGIIYGLSGFGLARQLNIPRGQAQEYIKAYFARYPKIRVFLDQCIEDATTRGFASTLCNRRRYLPNLSSKNKMIRQGSERIAMNTPLQGSAADLIKMAMLKVHARLRSDNLKSKLLLQVHDELVLEAPNEERDQVISLVREEMAGVMALRVPLVVDIGHGSTWAEAH